MNGDNGWDVFEDEDGIWVVNSLEGVPDCTDKLSGPFDTFEEAEAAGERLVEEYGS